MEIESEGEQQLIGAVLFTARTLRARLDSGQHALAPGSPDHAAGDAPTGGAEAGPGAAAGDAPAGEEVGKAGELEEEVGEALSGLITALERLGELSAAHSRGVADLASARARLLRACEGAEEGSVASDARALAKEGDSAGPDHPLRVLLEAPALAPAPAPEPARPRRWAELGRRARSALARWWDGARSRGPQLRRNGADLTLMGTLALGAAMVIRADHLRSKRNSDGSRYDPHAKPRNKRAPRHLPYGKVE